MARDFNYDRLETVQGSQDIADANEDDNECSSELRNPWQPRIPRGLLPNQSPVEKPDHVSVNSVETYESSNSSGSSLEKLEILGHRIRRKPLSRTLRGSIESHPAAEIERSRVGRGVWKDQLLVDRSLRTMAVLMTLFAIGMIILIASYAPHFRDRANTNTTSVGGEARSCKDVTHTNTAMLLLINVCATMILGMSNTYQQLITSLRVSDLKYVLSKFGDSRVGTNSPFSINQKRMGRKRSWAAWLFLVLTSMPVHFLGKFTPNLSD